ncbi:2-oxoglutarate dehydrogenase complex dihydrolipoyllysine-residue succinyltransferase [Marinibaculum pumilum]|uniref:Dihydrolipoyllysine-residue succinyltransferase component of 2-oxoglutarate dehydrogenase complex n=1 Tax=Marinibaculum pumilum TaxID=1766165 RepID=A0ABV7L1I0_9PROT
MAVEVRVPGLGDSVTEATVGKWFKAEGDAVEMDEAILELETDKVTMEVNAPAAGRLGALQAQEGDTVGVGDLLTSIEEGAAGKAPEKKDGKKDEKKAEKPAEKPAEKKAEAPKESQSAAPAPSGSSGQALPAAAKLAAEKGVDTGQVAGSGKGGRVTKGDVMAFLEGGGSAQGGSSQPAPKPAPSGPRPEAEREERVRMTKLRRVIAGRLKEAQNTAAMLTTFNEVDMTNLLAARKAYQDRFEKKHGVRLGFMSFFVKACIAGLRELPSVNAEIEGDEIVYKNYYHMGVAVSTQQGLVVPVLRDADRLGFADIERAIGDFGVRARDGKLKLEELQGGTFTISNGGVFGSLMSTPILNPPQSGVLGMHKIQERPMVVNGEIKVRPMMYLALSYDHRIIDGREAVTFLVRVKECVENPERILFDV